jgi:hypothetical protein
MPRAAITHLKGDDRTSRRPTRRYRAGRLTERHSVLPSRLGEDKAAPATPIKWHPHSLWLGKPVRDRKDSGWINGHSAMASFDLDALRPSNNLMISRSFPMSKGSLIGRNVNETGTNLKPLQIGVPSAEHPSGYGRVVPWVVCGSVICGCDSTRCFPAANERTSASALIQGGLSALWPYHFSGSTIAAHSRLCP